MEEWKKSLPEDTIDYFVYAFPQKNKAGSASLTSISKVLKDVKVAANQLVDKYLKGYIWQRDAFKLETKLKPKHSEASVSALSHLHGQTDFGDSIEDEWLIVWLLRELSKQFPQIWIRVTDSMGEFLLVEAANVLPGWLDPDVAEHRVWINKGELRLIPVVPAKKGSDQQASLAGPLTIEDARQYIFDEKPTLHPQLVEQEAFHRLRTYPEQIARNQHHAMAIIPRKLAFLLHENPSYICSAVDAFYLRDPIAMKPLMAQDTDSLTFPPSDFVSMRVKFTRVGFAQIRSQRFATPPAWEDAEKGYEDARLRQRAETGTKVCAGFEMLLADPQRQDERVVREIKMILEEVESGDVTLPKDQNISSWGTEGDDEKWMDIDFRDFEEELAGRKQQSGGSKAAGAGFGDKDAQENLRKMVQRFEDFLNDDTLDAYDVDDDDDDDDDDNKDSDEDSEDSSIAAGDASAPFSEDDFTKMMREMMGMPEEVMREIMTGKMDEEQMKQFAEMRYPERSKSTAGKNNTGGGGSGGSGGSSNKKADHADHAESEENNLDDSDEEQQILELSAAMEAELRSTGALDISDPQRGKAFERIKGSDQKSGKKRSNPKSGLEVPDPDSDEGEAELLDADYNLLSNMLQSFKGQAGMSGPGGNLMGLLGVRMPRDEDGDEDEDEDEHEGGEREEDGDDGEDGGGSESERESTKRSSSVNAKADKGKRKEAT